MGILTEILRDFPWYAWVAIVAIVAGATRSIVALSNRHEERMEMIKRGLDPSSLKDPID